MSDRVIAHGIKEPGATPTMGRIVRFQFDRHAHPAMVLNSADAFQDDQHRVHLRVFLPDEADMTVHDVPFHEGPDVRHGTWHWPERVP